MNQKKRLGIQGLAALLQNANFKGFFTGTISQGATKKVCVPGLNCYSCPGAVGACPIGSLQSSLTGFRFRFPYYVVGLLLFFGAVLGRAVCAFLCPFGLLQDLIYKIPFFKKVKTFKGDKVLRYLKYIVLIVMVFVLPIMIKLTPVFCKYLCPSGTVAGILLAISNSQIAALLGKRFVWKLCILMMLLVAGLLVARPFCRYLCPLGAIYGLMNRFSLLHITLDAAKCTGCGACARSCTMALDPVKQTNSPECIRCGDCIEGCSQEALSYCIGNHSVSYTVKNASKK